MATGYWSVVKRNLRLILYESCPSGGESGAEGAEEGGSWGRGLVLHKHGVKPEHPVGWVFVHRAATSRPGGGSEGCMCLEHLWVRGGGGRLFIIVMLCLPVFSISPSIRGPREVDREAEAAPMQQPPGRGGGGLGGGLATTQPQGPCGEFTTWREVRRNASQPGSLGELATLRCGPRDCQV